MKKCLTKNVVEWIILAGLIISFLIGVIALEVTVQKRWDKYEQRVFTEQGVK